VQIQVLQHVPFEGPGAIVDWAAARNHTIDITKVYEESLPPANAFDMLVVMGGPMGVYDELPWLSDEKELLRAVIQAGKPVLGVCLGAQLIADVLGACVYRGPEKEIGWFPVTFHAGARKAFAEALPAEATVFHWHGDTFDVPNGALPLASTAAVPNQGFLYADRVLALQFHVESTPESVAGLIANCRDEMTEGRFIQSEADIKAAPESLFAVNHALLFAVLDRITGASR
jgi:GMP synthase-like glutamine amidotransferase